MGSVVGGGRGFADGWRGRGLVELGGPDRCVGVRLWFYGRWRTWAVGAG